MIVNRSTLSAMFTNFSAAFVDGFGRASPDWQKVASLAPSSGAATTYNWLGQFPGLREWVGDRIIKNLQAHGYTITNKNYESTIEVDRNDIEDDQIGIFGSLMSEMGYTAAMHPDELVFALLAAGATELCFDGQPFFNASHPVIVSGAATTASNYDSAGGGNLWMLLDTKRPLKPCIFQKRRDYQFQAFNKLSDEHVFMSRKYLYGVEARVNVGFGFWQMAYGSLNTLNETNFNAYVAAMLAYKSDEDKSLNIKPDLLVCGPSNRAAARSLIETQVLANGASNPNYKAVDILVTNQLT